MTSLPVVPTKFYQVCRLCLTVVSDTNDLMNLSVFGGRHNAGCTATSAQTNTNEDNSMVVSASTNNSSNNSNNSGVIVKTIRAKNEARISSPTDNEHQHSANNSFTNNASDNEAAAGDGTARSDGGGGGGGGIGDDDNNNFKIDGDLHHSDILERIYTFLSITVSGSLLSFFFNTKYFFLLLVLANERKPLSFSRWISKTSELLIVLYCYYYQHECCLQLRGLCRIFIHISIEKCERATHIFG